MKTCLSAVALAAALILAPAAQADGPKRFPLSSAYQEECGSCHVAYPPQLLPARSWEAVLAGLDRHFGGDASLEPARAREIAGFLAAGAGDPRRFEGPGGNLKVTGTAWFQRKHREGHHGLGRAVWQSPAVRSAANCGACHPNASAGDYSEDDIRIPRTN